MIELHHGDCLTLLAGMREASVDALVSDPPAGIAFMGKEWDKDRGGRRNWVKYWIARFRAAMRVMKPGSHGLVWALPRTSHWTATALEDAGFELRDVLVHIFGQGFPKSHNGEWGGTALKPASEHWILVRKPLAGTVAANFAKHGTGGLNIDACRIFTDWSERSDAWKASGHSAKPDAEKIAAPPGQGINCHPAGRWPANVLLEHHEDCELVGTKRVKGTAPHGPNSGNGALGRLNDDGWQPKARTAQEYASADGTEEVADWRCVEAGSATVATFVYRESLLSPGDEPSRLLDRLLAVRRDLRERSTNDTALARDAVAALGIGDSRSSESGALALDAASRALGVSGLPGFRLGCPSCVRSHGERALAILEAARASGPSLADALERVAHLGASLERTPACRPSARHSNSGDSRDAERDADTPSSTAVDADRTPSASRESVSHTAHTEAVEPQRFEPRDSTQGSRIVAPSDSSESCHCNGGRSAAVRLLSLLGLELSRHYLPSSLLNRRDSTIQWDSCPVRMLDEQSGELATHGGSVRPTHAALGYGGGNGSAREVRADRGGASRFFYCGKATRRERGDENDHPTVKSTELMRYLTRLVTPKGGTVLDITMGSGSTGLACLAEGFSFIGIDLDAKNVAIARSRLLADSPLFAGVG